METSQPSFVDALEQAHHALLGHLARLEEAIRPESDQGAPHVRARLEKIRSHLLNHFRFEEQGGYMAPVLKEEPRLAPEAKELLEQHGQLANGLEALIDEIGAASSVEEAFRQNFHAWLRQVHQHEDHENRLVQEAYYSGGATGD
jgi:hypothetical protein